MPKLENQTCVSYQQLLLQCDGLQQAFLFQTKSSLILSNLEIILPVNALGRLMVPCQCQEDFVAAKIVNQCKRCKVFRQDCCKTLQSDVSNDSEICNLCLNHEKQAAAYNAKFKGKKTIDLVFFLCLV